MRPIWALLLYLAAVFIGGALLAPWLYWGADLAGLMDMAGRPPFHRFVTRCLLLMALAGVWPLLRFSRLDSWRGVGLAAHPRRWRLIAQGFLVGFASLSVIGAGALAAGVRAWHVETSSPPIVVVLLGIAATAVIVAVLEEILFRGTIFGTLRKFNHWMTALVISSAVYSVVHFFRKASIQASEITWSSGLELLPQMMSGFADPQQIVPGFFVLLLAGAILAAAYHRTESLHFPIGLHAGWIFWAQSYAVLTKQQAPSGHPFWGSAKIIDGWCGVIVLAPLLAWFLRPAAQMSGRQNRRAISAAEPLTGVES